MQNSAYYTRFVHPVPCVIRGHSMIPDGWPGEVIGIDHACHKGVGTCVRFDKPVPNCSQMMIWMLSPDVIYTESDNNYRD